MIQKKTVRDYICNLLREYDSRYTVPCMSRATDGTRPRHGPVAAWYNMNDSSGRAHGEAQSTKLLNRVGPEWELCPGSGTYIG